jgi:hypothetical protein
MAKSAHGVGVSRRRLAVGLLLALVAPAGPAWAQAVSVEALLRDPVRYDRSHVVVRGTVGAVQAGRGFMLMDGIASVWVAGAGGPPVNPGDRVEVQGRFDAGRNLVEAFRVGFR